MGKEIRSKIKGKVKQIKLFAHFVFPKKIKKNKDKRLKAKNITCTSTLPLLVHLVLPPVRFTVSWLRSESFLVKKRY